MCLGIPGKIVEVTEPEKRLGMVEIGGVRRLTNLACVADPEHPIEALEGAWVLVHVGFAMSRIDPEEAERTLKLLTEMGELQEELDAMEQSGKA
ncbi:MAG: HypC/HybG/HupF family hydrogenase formation chaperone [Myxococcota bacterium]